mmetsp:Transcript_29183/g.89267  ORF Transcript_29183/g.89267 Transcript_29183/m.89267 type:complete len:200 (+) Transcript_29183:110-709(+)
MSSSCSVDAEAPLLFAWLSSAPCSRKSWASSWWPKALATDNRGAQPSIDVGAFLKQESYDVNVVCLAGDVKWRAALMLSLINALFEQEPRNVDTAFSSRGGERRRAIVGRLLGVRAVLEQEADNIDQFGTQRGLLARTPQLPIVARRCHASKSLLMSSTGARNCSCAPSPAFSARAALSFLLPFFFGISKPCRLVGERS